MDFLVKTSATAENPKGKSNNAEDQSKTMRFNLLENYTRALSKL